MPRYRLTLEYDGGPFVGWQRQAEGASVQCALEDAIEKLSAERVTVTGAGRTDAGVHALGQVAHFDLDKTFEAGKVRDALNYYLRPAPVVVLDAAGLVACGLGALRLLRLQRPGRGPLPVGDFLRGFPLPAGAVLG